MKAPSILFPFWLFVASPAGTATAVVAAAVVQKPSSNRKLLSSSDQEALDKIHEYVEKVKKEADNMSDDNDELAEAHAKKLEDTIETTKGSAQDARMKVRENREKIDEICDDSGIKKCKKERRNYNKKNREEIEKTENEVHGVIRDFLEDYAKDLSAVRKMGADYSKKIHKYMDKALEEIEKPEYAHLDSFFFDDIDKMEHELERVTDIDEELDSKLGVVERFMYGYVCFQLEGASEEIPPREFNNFNNATEVALTLAFGEEGTEVDMQTVQITKQEVMADDSWRRGRNLRASWNQDHRALGMSLLVAVSASWKCECGTDAMTSDVFARRARLLLENEEEDPMEIRRQLWTDEIIEGYSHAVLSFLEDDVDGLMEVTPVPCEDFTSDL
eukprot:CAMPEP_0118718044 /NCGR_PEP_ID=MMETSP0800-20121206/28561_1 /TAXON_ID=210618 ORGANISM="Striatella unipunctata, Strain CCMP2910" /NCGR_SAMPLE_ID=MMETSP0800 /ASSEMBLY_ACC=CAM_ASM_000638 /LENGTH=387 /DNA_ID=CAMNT_0006624979 /DNA_START=94 /DNA_END=1257 /DNA_ORIENTATION=-